MFLVTFDSKWKFGKNMSDFVLITLPDDIGKDHQGNSSPFQQNGRHFADDIFECNFMNEYFVFWFEFHWNLFLRAQLTTIQHYIR